jgi:hypothetical protein
MSEADAVVRILGTDPWMRFDLWSNRAWEAAQGAVAVATANGPTINTDDDLDHRIITLFHAASVAKEFADMVSPIQAASGTKGSSDTSKESLSDITLDMIIDSGD